MTEADNRRMPVRSNRLMMKRYRQYLFPAMITYAALSLNEFVDSMLVSNLLGSDAMAVVSLGIPVMLVMSAAYALLGNGGSAFYAMSLGRRDRESAGRALTASLAASLAVGLVIMLPGVISPASLAGLLCHEETLLPRFEKYLFVLTLSAPLIVMILTFASFLPAAGHPHISTAVNVIANVVNIVMDYVYIRGFGMGVEGAAWATLTGYFCAGIFVAGALAAGKAGIFISRDILGSLPVLRQSLALGRPDAMNQIGLSFQSAVCNRLAGTFGGADGVVALSLCLQAGSVMSVFIASIMATSAMMIAVLHGQSDYRGQNGMLKSALLQQLVVSAAGAALFIVFAPQAAAFYNIKEASQLAVSVHALRVYALLFVPRYAVLVYYQYLKVIGLDRYSTVLSSLDSFALIIPAAFAGTAAFGLEGLWAAFPASAVILLIAVLICNRSFAAGSGGRLRGPLLLECGDGEGTRTVLDATVSKDSDDISLISERLQQACEDRGIGRAEAMKAAVAAEEIAVYTADRKRSGAYADIIVRLRGDNVEIDFRSIGELFDPHEDGAGDTGDIAGNLKILRDVASEIENEYVLGMNMTRIIISGADRRDAESKL